MFLDQTHTLTSVNGTMAGLIAAAIEVTLPYLLPTKLRGNIFGGHLYNSGVLYLF